MADLLLGDLKQEISERNAVAIVGAGVSMLATGGAACASWTGLLHDGAARCVELFPDLAGKWREVVDWEIDSGDLDNMLSAAEKITSKLRGNSGGEYRRWLRESVGGLKAKDADVLHSLHSLGIPIATTNYAGLIEEATNLPAVTWREKAKVERILHGDDPAWARQKEASVPGKPEKLRLALPAGLKNGDRLQFQRDGNPGINGGSAGDLHVVIVIR